MTNRNFISDIWSDLRVRNIDDFISPKAILSKGIDVAGNFIKKANYARIVKLQEGWKELVCFPLKEVPVTECADIDTYICKKLMRSKERLPDTFTSPLGNVIRTVASDTLSSFYDPITPRQWKNIQYREFQDKTKNYYFFIGGYLYIPIKGADSPTPQEIRVEAYFLRQWEVEQLNAQNNDCKTCPTECIKPLDSEFTCPVFLLDDVKKETVKQIAQVYLRVTPDSFPNMDENNKVGEKPTN